MEVIVAELLEKDANKISEIWVKALPADIISILGEDFIQQAYLPFFFSREKKLGLKITSYGEMAGFIIFDFPQNFLSNLIQQNFLFLVARLISAALKSPQKIFNIFNVFIFILLNKQHSLDSHFELLYVAIDNKFQNQGLGFKLVNAALGKISEKAIDSTIIVKTLSSTKETNHFYKKLGFELYKNIYGRNFYRIKVSNFTDLE